MKLHISPERRERHADQNIGHPINIFLNIYRVFSPHSMLLPNIGFIFQSTQSEQRSQKAFFFALFCPRDTAFIISSLSVKTRKCMVKSTFDDSSTFVLAATVGVDKCDVPHQKLALGVWHQGFDSELKKLLLKSEKVQISRPMQSNLDPHYALRIIINAVSIVKKLKTSIVGKN